MHCIERLHQLAGEEVDVTLFVTHSLGILIRLPNKKGI